MRLGCPLILAAIVAGPVTARADDGAVDHLVAEVLELNPSIRARALRRDAFGGEAKAAGIHRTRRSP
jgi:hypothetical protein